ncbi:TfuA-like core domain-containing protein [Methanobacterium lacus]|uniref:TfuA-like core domain-containing protein n=1 Tax=Methanobacterium lacus (strain AL-21) TaxID=877455 RepID=F0TCQ9_METLA|nr:TfuA-related McrA-glycine thioamidation protein [Methanobacterium lacus]ADZ10449.1 TfuA-like core domain-containing protein [Methanobacterium lacus]
MVTNKKIIIFTGPSLQPKEAETILKADYRPPIARGDIIQALTDEPDIIGIIDGVFHKEPAVSHKEILEALKKDVTVVGGASMGALRASELDDFGMVGVGQVYMDYKTGVIESDDDVAVVINPDTMEQLSEALISINYTFKAALKQGVINRSDYDLLIKTAKSIYYPKRSYSKVFAESGLEKSKVELLQKFLEVHAIDVKRMDALAVLDYIKKIAI